MIVVFAVFWETSYLRLVTVDVKWWHDQDGKLWLFYLALLQLSQGALFDRLIGELRQVLFPARPSHAASRCVHPPITSNVRYLSGNDSEISVVG